MTIEETLLDTLTYYCEDPVKRRNYDPNLKGVQWCTYGPLKPTSEGCAIGRYLDESSQNTLDNGSMDFEENLTIDNLFETYKDLAKKVLPKWMYELPLPFLVSLQNLHDVKENWEEKGLSVLGIDIVEDLISEYKLDRNKFISFLT